MNQMKHMSSIAVLLDILQNLDVVDYSAVNTGSPGTYAIAMRKFNNRYKYNINEHPERELNYKNNKELL